VWTAGGIVGAALLVVIVYSLIQNISPEHANADENRAEPAPSEPVHVEVSYPQRGQSNRTTTQPGTVEPFESEALYARVTGYIEALKVDIGKRVKKKDLLIHIDVPDLQKQVERADAALLRSQAEVKQMTARIDAAEAELKAAHAEEVQSAADAKSKAAALRFRQQQYDRMVALMKDGGVIDERLVDEKREQRDAALEAKNAADAAILTTKAKTKAAEARIERARADKAEAEAEVKLSQAELGRARVMLAFADNHSE
jgi:multidrug resistance efflux pump